MSEPIAQPGTGTPSLSGPSGLSGLTVTPGSEPSVPQLRTPLGPPVPLDPPLPRVGKEYAADRVDAVFAVVAVVLGFLFWNWIWPTSGEVKKTFETGGSVMFVMFYPGVGVTALFVLAVAASLAYFRLRGLNLTRGAWIGAGLILLTALPFTLYDTTPVHFFAGLALLTGYVVWHAYAAGTAVSARLGTLTAADAVNQGLAVPLGNLGAWFAGVGAFVRQRKAVTRVVVALVGVLVALPVLAIVLALLMSADSGFSDWMSAVGDWVGRFQIWTFVWQFCLGLLVALYLFGLWYGNAYRRGVAGLTADKAGAWARSWRRIPGAAIVAPVGLLCVLLVVFFAAMGTYLFSAFGAKLPGDFTYAEYARRGFFELVAVAAINLCVLAFTWLFARRTATRWLRALGGVLAGLTILLILTAASKMLLYVGEYGLTQLRVYTLWFMAVLLVVFVLLAIWHIRPFRVSTPIVVFTGLAFLGLTWANTDAIVADYNVWAYETGQLKTIDVAYLAENLSDAALPALVRLGEDPRVAAEVQTALDTRATNGTTLTPPIPGPWTSWNWQWYQAGWLHHGG